MKSGGELRPRQPSGQSSPPRIPRGLVLLAGLLLCAGMAGAQTIYRCGPDGRSYSQQPCDDGAPIEADDTRSAQQQGEAEARRARLVREAQALPVRVPEAGKGAAVVHTRRPLPDPVSVTGPQSYKVKSPSSGRTKAKQARRGKSAADAQGGAASAKKKRRSGS